MQTQNWTQELWSKYRAAAAHTFVVHGAVRDYVTGNYQMGEALTHLFQKWDVVAFYDLAHGWSFPTAEHQSHAEGYITSLSAKAPQEAQDPNALNMAALMGQGSDPWAADLATAMETIDNLLHAPSKSNGNGESGTRVCVVVNSPEAIWPRADMGSMSPQDRQNLVRLQNWATDRSIGDNYNALVLVTPDLLDLHEKARGATSRVEAVNIPLPGAKRRLEFVLWLLDRMEDAELEEGLGPIDVARETAAMQLWHIEDLFLRAQAHTGVLTRALVRERKAEVMAAEFGDVLTIVEPAVSFDDIGGLDYLKTYCRQAIVKPMAEGHTTMVPKAMLLAGPPGTGKSLFAEALGKEAGMTLVMLDPSKMKGKFVGESEAKTVKTFQALEALAPCLVFVDEVDQHFRRGEGGRSGDSGVSDFIFGKLLNFMGRDENRGLVCWLLATNRPDSLDPALLRMGRTDKVVALLAPDRDARIQIIRVMLERKYKARHDLGTNDVFVCAMQMEGYTGAVIGEVCRKAVELAYFADADAVDRSHMAGALEAIRPDTRGVAYMTNLALRYVNDLSLLPPEAQEKAQDRQALEEEAQAMEEAQGPRKVRDI